MQQAHCNQGMLTRDLVPKQVTGSVLSRISNSRNRPGHVLIWKPNRQKLCDKVIIVSSLVTKWCCSTNRIGVSYANRS